MQPAGSNAQKLGDFYRAYLDTDAIDRAGLAPARAGTRRHRRRRRTHEDLARLMGRPDLRAHGAARRSASRPMRRIPTTTW